MNLIPQSLGSLVRFLIGILLVQGVTLLLAYTALQTNWRETWPLFAMLGAAIGVLASFWFNTIVFADRHRAVSRLSERFMKEREKIRVKAEQQRAKDGRSNERLAARAKRSSSGMSLKTGVVVGGAVGVGVAMMMAQLMTLGLATLAAAGGVALGYGVRARQDKWLVNRRLGDDGTRILVEQEPPSGFLPRRSARATDADEPDRA